MNPIDSLCNLRNQFFRLDPYFNPTNDFLDTAKAQYQILNDMTLLRESVSDKDLSETYKAMLKSIDEFLAERKNSLDFLKGLDD